MAVHWGGRGPGHASRRITTQLSLLFALALDDTSVPEDSAATINITGATSGSTITVQSGSLPSGMTLNSGARTISGTPPTAGSSSFTLRETLADSPNSPRDTALNITISAAAGPDLDIFAAATQASATPTTVVMTLESTITGFRVWSGDQPLAEENFTLYVKKNSDAVYPVQMHRWQGRIFNGAAGDTFAFGTSDGRTLKFAQMVVPAALPTISGATGTANCDKAGPPLWTPTAAHITLPTTGSAFQIDSDGTEQIVFIAEKSPDGTWSPLRWVRHSATRATKVQCNYQEVALANYAGATLAITAPTGTTIGGTNAPMALPIPAVTGTTHSPTTVATLKTAIAAAVAGDAIVIATGTYALDVAITDASFTANEALGNQGAEGILIRSSSGTRSDVVISGTSGTNGNFALTQTGATAYASFKDLTFDFGALATQFAVTAGKFYFQNVSFKNGSGTDQVTMSNIPGTLLVYALNCRFEDGGGDLVNAGSNVSGTYNSSTVVQLINCDAQQPSNSSTSQCVTSHDGMVVELYGGTYDDANTNVLANDAETTPAYAFFAAVTPGARSSGIANGWKLFGMNWTVPTATAGLSSVPSILFSRLGGSKTTSTHASIRNTAVTKHNIVTVTGARSVHSSIQANIIGNIITGSDTAIRNGDAASAMGSSNINFNTLASNTTGLNHPTTTNDPAVFNSNAAKTHTTSVNTTAGADATLTGDYNVLDTTVDADYSAGANDTTGSDAALDSDYFPTAAGNCDDNGEWSKFGYVGGSDPFGFVLSYKQSVISRGARSRPIIRSGAELYPDFW